MPFFGDVSGERFEYEMSALLKAAKSNIPIVRVPIETVYEQETHSTHFHPIRDSVKIYWEILKYSLSSLVSSGIDISSFALFRALLFQGDDTGIMLSTVTARLISGICNFAINKRFVFGNKDKSVGSLVKYAALFVFCMFMSGLTTKWIAEIGAAELLAKIIADSALFALNFLVQKNLVFRTKRMGAYDKTLFKKTLPLRCGIFADTSLRILFCVA
jgi:putative flippase GtrA